MAAARASGTWACSTAPWLVPLNLVAYGAPDLPALAASLGYGLARNHPFVDGNKRTAYVAVETFLALNSLDLVADDAECVVVMLDLAAGDLPEAPSPPGCATTPARAAEHRDTRPRPSSGAPAAPSLPMVREPIPRARVQPAS